MNILWGIDLGGTKIEGVVMDAQSVPLKVLARKRIPTESAKGYAHILSQIQILVFDLQHETGISLTTLGIGTPGALEPSTQTLKNSNTLCLNGKPIQKDLEKLLGIPVKLANDANCLALAEATLGAASTLPFKPEVVFGIIMGTGVGGGLIVNNQVINGANGIAGEWGHNHLDNSGGVCYCGKVGCVEKIISGPALEHWYESLTGNKLPLAEIVALSEQGSDHAAVATIQRLIEYFGKAVAVLINILDPQVIVLGGGVSNIDALYSLGYDEIMKHVFNPNGLNTILLKPLLGDSAGVFGAAMLTA